MNTYPAAVIAAHQLEARIRAANTPPPPPAAWLAARPVPIAAPAVPTFSERLERWRQFTARLAAAVEAVDEGRP